MPQYEAHLKSLVQQRLTHKGVLQSFIQPGVGRVLANNLKFVGLHGLFGEDIFEVFEEIIRENPSQNPVFAVGDILEEILVDWFLGLSREELSGLLPREEPAKKEENVNSRLCDEDRWITDLLD